MTTAGIEEDGEDEDEVGEIDVAGIGRVGCGRPIDAAAAAAAAAASCICICICICMTPIFIRPNGRKGCCWRCETNKDCCCARMDLSCLREQAAHEHLNWQEGHWARNTPKMGETN